MLTGAKQQLREWRVPWLGRLRIHAPRPAHLPCDYFIPPVLSSYPRFSIATPSFRQGEFIERTIQSVLDSGYPALDYAVMDGGSDDGTVDVLRRYESRLAYWQSAPDRGQTVAINCGFDHVPDGEIMAYLNSDDLLLPGALHAVAQAFQRHPHVEVIYGHRLLIDVHDREIGRWILPPHEPDILRWADFVPQETLFWRRSLWERVGGRLDESFTFAMDWELLLRFLQAGAKFLRLPRLLGAFRIHADQKTLVQMNGPGQAEIQRLRHMVHGRPVTQSEVDNAISGYLGRHLAWNAASRVKNAVWPGRTMILGGATAARESPASGLLDVGAPLSLARMFARNANGDDRDIVSGTGVRLEQGGWHALERQHGFSFRWAEDRAAIHVRSLVGGRMELRFDVELGPSLSPGPRHFTVSDSCGRQICSTQLSSRQDLRIPVDVPAGKDAAFTLAVESDHLQPVPHDPRRLCFRAFAIVLALEENAS